MRIVIVIPVYKPILSADEEHSLRQCISVLGNYQVTLVCPDGLNVSEYSKVAGRELRCETFQPSFFENIDGYNRLMMSRMFYERFSGYDYMLIYQLDAWVFSDELTEWCLKGYDYVGAPWFELNHTHEEAMTYGLLEMADCRCGVLRSSSQHHHSLLCRKSRPAIRSFGRNITHFQT